MNGTYYQNPTFPGVENNPGEMTNYTGNIVPVDNQGPLPMEQSYIENILRLNKGRRAKIYVSFPDSLNWKDKIFDGRVEQAGRDHIVMSLDDGRWVLVPMIYLDYAEFNEQINYRPSDLVK